MAEDIDSAMDPIPTDAPGNPPYPAVKRIHYLMPIAYTIVASIILPLSTGLFVPFGALLQMPYSILIVLLIAFAIGNISLSPRANGKADPLYFVRTMLIVRYGMIPFFLWITVQVFALVHSTEWNDSVLTRFDFICWIAISFFFLLPGAFYGLRVIRINLREKKISRDTAIFHDIAQFIPVLGFLDSAFLSAVKMKKVRMTSLVVLIILVALLCLIMYLILVTRFAIEFAHAWQYVDLFVSHWFPIPAVFY